jgi:hypothetical protein
MITRRNFSLWGSKGKRPHEEGDEEGWTWDEEEEVEEEVEEEDEEEWNS